MQPPPPLSPETAPRAWSVEVSCRGMVGQARHRVLSDGFCVSCPTLGRRAPGAVVVRRCNARLIGLWPFPRTNSFLGISCRSEWSFPSSSFGGKDVFCHLLFATNCGVSRLRDCLEHWLGITWHKWDRSRVCSVQVDIMQARVTLRVDPRLSERVLTN